MEDLNKYDTIEDCLKALNVVDVYLKNFQDQKIDDGIISFFTENELEKCIPELGIRKRFYLMINARLSKDATLSFLQPADGSSSASSTSYTSSNQLNPESSTSTIHQNFSLTGDSSSLEETSMYTIEDPRVSSTPSIEISDLVTCNSTSQNNSIIVLNSERVPIFDITTIMKKYDPVYGLSILESIQNQNSMNTAQRKSIVNAATQYLFDISPGQQVTAALKERMAEYLASVFRFMPKICWYQKNPKGNPTGYLAYRIGNVRRSIKKKIPGQKTVSNVNPKPNQHAPHILTESEFNERKQWLKDNRSDTATVIKYLKDTFSRRRVEVEEKGLMVEDWPRLFDDANMVNLEFSQLPQGNVSDLSIYSKWTEAAARKILEFCDSQSLDWKAKLSVKCDTVTGEGLFVCSASILPFLFHGAASIVNRKRRKLSSLDSLFYFLEVFPVGTNIEALCGLEKKRSQPFILVLGNAINCQFEQFFVMAERKIIVCSSFLHALDTCFKLYWIMKADFPSECRDCWDFISSFVYSLTTPKSSHMQLIHYISNTN